MMILVANPDRRLHIGLWLSLAVLLFWSAWHPKDLFTWFLEVVPVFIGSGVLLVLYPRFRFSRLVCWLLWAHAIVLMIGGHYTYAEVPLFNWIRDTFHLARNHYDRLGHFMQGFVPAMIAREVFVRKRIIQGRGWLFFLVVCVCLAISAAYELFEWLTAVATGTKAEAFLGTQGDPWDTQWDMAMALIGALVALAGLHRIQDRSIERLGGST
jgi:putative membrane protein